MGETVAVFENNTPTFYNILAGEEIIGQFDGQNRRYHIKDHLGSVRMTINDSQGIDGYQDYYPFGKINLSDSRRMPGRSYTSGNLYDNYKFTGHERDDEFDLTLDYMQARMYDPVIGRFLSVDPLVDEFPFISSYSYVLNNPLFFVDPTGKSPVCGQEDNCDDTYEVGSTVENIQGSWEYLGGNEWRNLSFGNNISANLLYTIFDRGLDGNGTISQYQPSHGNRVKDTINSYPPLQRFIGNMLYDTFDAAYISVLSLQRGNSRTNIAGELVTGSRITDSGVKTLTTLFPYSQLMRVPGLNAAQFSQAFKGTFLTRLQPSTRGVINRKFNKYLYSKQNDYFIKGSYISSDNLGNK